MSEYAGIHFLLGDYTTEYDINDQNGQRSIEDIGSLSVPSVQTGHITLEMLQQAMTRIDKAEYVRPQWIVEPDVYELIKEYINTE